MQPSSCCAGYGVAFVSIVSFRPCGPSCGHIIEAKISLSEAELRPALADFCASQMPRSICFSAYGASKAWATPTCTLLASEAATSYSIMPQREGTMPLTFSQGVARAVELWAELSALVDALPSLDADALPLLDGNAAVRLDDVEALIRLKENLGKWEGWEARNAALESYRMAMSEHLPPAQQLRMLLGQAGGGGLRWTGVLKDTLLGLLASPAATPEDISAAWMLVHEGHLSLPASAASPEFIRHVLFNVSRSSYPPNRAYRAEEGDSDSGALMAEKSFTKRR